MTKAATPPLHLDRLDTPIGTALLATDAQGRLCIFEWADHAHRFDTAIRRYFKSAPTLDADAPGDIRRALVRYFAGDLDRLDDIACSIPGTPFQNNVWRALRRIPVGTTLSYGTLAAQLGVGSATRAVGYANGANPLSVVVPCHRLIGANGALTGYGGGIERKRWLLRHEGVEVE